MNLNAISRHLISFITVTEGVFILSGIERSTEKGALGRKLLLNLIYIAAAELVSFGALTLLSRLGWDERYVAKLSIILALSIFGAFFSKYSSYTRVTVIFVCYTASILMRNIRTVLFQHLTLNLTVYNALSILFYAVLLAVSGVFIKKYSIKSSKAIPLSYWLTIVIAVGGYEALGAVIDVFWENGLLTDLQTRMWDNLVSELAMFLLCMTAYFMIYNISAYYAQKQEMSLLRLKQNEIMTDVTRANQMYDDIRVLRHEFKNHVLTMRAYAKTGEYEKLIRYLDRYLKTDGKVLTYIDCGNRVLNNILNYKSADLAEKGVELVPMISVPEELPFEEIDITSLLVNLIDNAAEASLKSSAPAVRLNIIVEKGYCFVTVTNPVSKDVMAENPTLATTKEDGANHGIGLRVVRNIVEKYNGFIDFEQKADTFIVSAMLSLNAVKKE